eukprot:7383515-Prymnesium_polylepis.1
MPSSVAARQTGDSIVRTPVALDAGVSLTTTVLLGVLLGVGTSSVNDDGGSAPTAASDLEVDLKRSATLSWDTDLKSHTTKYRDMDLTIPATPSGDVDTSCVCGSGASNGFRATRTASRPAKMASPGSRSSPPLSAMAI